MIPQKIRVCAGLAVQIPIETHLYGGKPARYQAGDTLAGYLYRSGIPSAVFSPTVAYYTAGSTVDGYDQGWIVISWDETQGALLVPRANQWVRVTRVISGDTHPYPIAMVPLDVVGTIP